jgi:hypothetical protein
MGFSMNSGSGVLYIVTDQKALTGGGDSKRITQSCFETEGG